MTTSLLTLLLLRVPPPSFHLSHSLPLARLRLCLQYGEDHEAKTKGRANKLLTESKRLATVYTEKVNEVLRVQDEEM